MLRSLKINPNLKGLAIVKLVLLLVFLLAASFADAYGYVPYGESGLRQGKARYLSNDLTRFTSVDPARSSADARIPQSWNRYAYSLNNPLNLIDPNGLRWYRVAYVYGSGPYQGKFAHEALVDVVKGKPVRVQEMSRGAQWEHKPTKENPENYESDAYAVTKTRPGGRNQPEVPDPLVPDNVIDLGPDYNPETDGRASEALKENIRGGKDKQCTDYCESMTFNEDPEVTGQERMRRPDARKIEVDDKGNWRLPNGDPLGKD